MQERSAVPELNATGDRIGARRLRRAFRIAVASCVVFTTTLWFAERYLRYDLAESQYMAALTLAPESARAILRQVVKRDAQQREFPTPKYTAALAEREEADLIIPTYQAACKLDPNNALLAVRYGCRLFLVGKFQEARDTFRQASQLMPENALPGYLEAAALAMASENEEAISNSLALVARTNEGAGEMRFPQPLWASALPAGGIWYDNLQRQIVDECSAPLYRYARRIAEAAERRIALKDFQNWDSWLATLQRMGERIAHGKDNITAPQLIAGIHIQLAALEQREAIALGEKGTSDERLVEKRTELKSALGLLNQFEDTRDKRIAVEKNAYVFPLRKCGEGMAILFSAYVLAYLSARLGRARRQGWTVEHPRWIRGAMLATYLLLLGLLAAMSAIQAGYSSENANGEALVASEMGVVFSLLGGIWFALFLTIVGFGLIYPFIVVSDSTVADEIEEKTERRKALRRARLSLMRRYFGIQAGLLLCVISFWTIGYRVTAKTYPWQVELLETSLHAREQTAIKQAISLFTPTP